MNWAGWRVSPKVGSLVVLLVKWVSLKVVKTVVRMVLSLVVWWEVL